MVVGTADRGAGAPTLPLLRTRPRIRPPAPLLSSIRGPVRRNDILALEDLPKTGPRMQLAREVKQHPVS
jgi:hypothetical protein